MPKIDWLNKPVWSTALVATLLLGAITTSLGTAVYIVERFAKIETAIAILQSTVVSRDEFFAYREQAAAHRYTQKDE